MEDITQKLQQLVKSGQVSKLIFKQSTQKKASLFVNDLSIKKTLEEQHR